METNKLKFLYTAMTGGLTMSCMYACNWQWRRYNQSKARWEKIDESLRTFSPESLTAFQSADEMEKAVYRLAGSKGKFSDQHILVFRGKDGRIGYNVVKPFLFSESEKVLGGKEGVLVNVGWIPGDIDYNDKMIKSNETLGRFCSNKMLLG